jgi:hypothetical protein
MQRLSRPLSADPALPLSHANRVPDHAFLYRRDTATGRAFAAVNCATQAVYPKDMPAEHE